MRLMKRLVRDPSNPSRTKWGYYIWMQKKRKSGWFRITRSYFMDIKYNRLFNEQRAVI